MPFKLEKSDEKLTARAGLLLVAESAERYGLKRDFARELPPPGSNRGHEAWTELPGDLGPAQIVEAVTNDATLR